ncbi:MAG: GTPase HflX [Eubacteriales bacterium]|nr:GTPase HflX [Eubacteriales bacterium]
MTDKSKLYNNIDEPQERVVLVGVASGSEEEAERSVEELALLAKTAGAKVVGKAIQNKDSIDPVSYVGKGKISEIAAACDELEADTIICDDELNGSQIRHISEMTGRKVIDRTLLILDIFAQRAVSAEGKMQVELAQLKYRYSRLSGMGRSLSRLGGGIGTRGPGETKLETDRRHINRRIGYIKNALKQTGVRRDRIRGARRESDAVTIAVVGYTNAGKSTLINVLCESNLYAENKLFATLDATARRLPFSEGVDVVLMDTVGFIRKLPHQLIEAFNSTLEEIADADMIMHVVDTSDPDMTRHMEIAEELLGRLKATSKPRITVFNKIDVKGFEDVPYDPAFNTKDGTVIPVSAHTGEGVGYLLEELKQIAKAGNVSVRLYIPYSDAGALDHCRKYGTVANVSYEDDCITADVLIPRSRLPKVSAYMIK